MHNLRGQCSTKDPVIDPCIKYLLACWRFSLFNGTTPCLHEKTSSWREILVVVRIFEAKTAGRLSVPQEAVASLPVVFAGCTAVGVDAELAAGAWVAARCQTTRIGLVSLRLADALAANLGDEVGRGALEMLCSGGRSTLCHGAHPSSS